MDEKALLAEATVARRECRAAKQKWLAARGEATEAKKLWREAAARVEEILDEADPDIQEEERPMLAMLDRREAEKAAPVQSTNGDANGIPSAPPAGKPRKRERPDTKLAGLELPTAKELIMDAIPLLDRSLEVLNVADETVARLSRLGVKTVGQLVGHKSLGYEDLKIVAQDYIAAHGEANTEKLTWTSEDVDHELTHALLSWRSGTVAQWAALIADGATNEDIRLELQRVWPGNRVFIPPSETGGAHGYTIMVQGKDPAWWIGAYLGHSHRPTLYGTSLFERVRGLLEIPTPSAAAKLKAAAAPQKREPTSASGTGFAQPPAAKFVAEPEGGWDSASIANAADDLGVGRDDLAICSQCRGARGHGGKCPCGSVAWHTAADELLGRRSAKPPARRRNPHASRRA